MPIVVVLCSLFTMCDMVNAAARPVTRGTAVARKPVASSTTEEKTATRTTPVAKPQETEISKSEVSEQKPEPIIENKANQFDATVSENASSLIKDDSFAEQIRKQKNALSASEAKSNLSNEQKKALSTNSSTCDQALRKCMMETCDKDFTKCALDGDTIFGDKLNRCKNKTECTAEEFNLFAPEIKADRDMNVRLASYNSVITCGNNYNSCIQKECGNTFGKCLGKTAADAAIQKCSGIAKDCTESDSGLAARFGTAIGKLRENAEKDIKTDEERLYALRDLMRQQCSMLGATFDERSFDCVYTVEFYAGEDQSIPTASRKRYAGDTFVCMQEWFGINATTYKENAYRETRSQTAASSAMLGAGVGTAVGTITSGAMGRALDAQKTKKASKSEKDEDVDNSNANQNDVQDTSGSNTSTNKVSDLKLDSSLTIQKPRSSQIGTNTPNIADRLTNQIFSSK